MNNSKPKVGDIYLCKSEHYPEEIFIEEVTQLEPKFITKVLYCSMKYDPTEHYDDYRDFLLVNDLQVKKLTKKQAKIIMMLYK